MKAITVEPKNSGSARLEDIPEPDVRNGSVLKEIDLGFIVGQNHDG